MKNGVNAKIELYNLTADPGEKNDLAANKPDLVEKAASLLKSEHTPDENWPLTGLAEARKKQPAVK